MLPRSLVALLLAATGLAASGCNGCRGHHHHGAAFHPRDRPVLPKPPHEALDACEDLEEDDVCSFTRDEEETVNGTCRPGPRPELPLACRPDDHTRPEPPPED